MPQPLEPLPEFANEAEERAFWENHDTVDYFDWSAARSVHMPNLRPDAAAERVRHEPVHNRAVSRDKK